MPLRKQALPISFSGGTETKADPKQVPQTQLLDLQNATFTKRGSLAKRNGYEALGQVVDDAAMTYTDVRGLAERDGELVLFAESSSYSYRPSSDTWSDIGDVMSVTATTTPLARTGTVQGAPDAATLSGITVLAWEDSRGGVWGTVVEEGTGRILSRAQALDSNVNAADVRCIACGDVLAVLWGRGDLASIQIALVNPAVPGSFVAATTLTSDWLASSFDAVTSLADTGRPGMIAWTTADGYRISYIASSGVLGSPVTGFSSAITVVANVDGPIALVVDSHRTALGAVLYSDGVELCAAFFGTQTLGTFAIFRTLTSLVLLSSTPNRITGAWGTDDGQGFDSNFLWWAYEHRGTRTDLDYVEVGQMTSGASDYDLQAGGSVLRGHCLASKAWSDGTDNTTTSSVVAAGAREVYVCVVHSVQFFPYVAAIRVSSHTGFGYQGANGTTCVARMLTGAEAAGSLEVVTTPGGGGGGGGGGSVTTNYSVTRLPSVTDVGLTTSVSGTRVHSIPLSYRIQLESDDGQQFAEVGIKIATLNFDDDASFQTATLGRGLYLAGAVPMHYDGNAWGEADIHTAPDVGDDGEGVYADFADLFVPSAGGAMTVDSTYLYKVWYEFVDAQGELHQGPTHSVTVIMGETDDMVTISLPTYRMTQRSNVRIAVARSPANQTGADVTIPCYRVTAVNPANNTGNNRYVDNDPSADTVTFVDALSDIDLITREPLYTNGGILSNDPAAWGGGIIAGGKNRLFWTDQTDPDLVRFSQEQADETAIEAPTSLSVRVDPYGGAITGIAALDDAVIVFKETAIYAFGGPGPDADGGFTSQNAFSAPQLVTSDVGCAGPASIAQTPEGIVFATSKGIYLLDRSRQVKSIGDPVYAYKDQFFTRATLLPDRHQVVFLTSSGRSLLWDYEVNQWSTYTNHEGLDASVIAGTYHYLRTDGRVFRETPGVFADDNMHIVMAIETAWIKMSGYLQGWQRVIHAMFVGAYVSSHSLRVRYRIDYQDAYSAPIDIDVDADYVTHNYGDGAYGDDAYGGAGGSGTVYQQRIHINKRCQAISFRVEDVEPTAAFGAAFELSEMLLTGGVIGVDFKPGASRQS